MNWHMSFEVGSILNGHIHPRSEPITNMNLAWYAAALLGEIFRAYLKVFHQVGHSQSLIRRYFGVFYL